MHRTYHLYTMIPCIWAVLLLLLVAAPEARILRVPSEFTLIQSAIDSSWSGDTILVESGRYEEALVVSGRSLTIIGLSNPDTVTGNGAIIDPTSLVNSNEIACLTLEGGDSIRLERLWFKNGMAMHVNRPVNRPGGIDNEFGPELLTLKSCRFDSVHTGIRRGFIVVLDSVVMHDMQRSCLSHGDTARHIARDCRFEGAMSGIAVSSWTGSQFVRCAFTNTLSGWLLSAAADCVFVSECDFGPFTSPCGYAVVVRPGHGTVIENNVFHDMNTSGIVLRVIQGNCSTIVDPDYRHVVIRNNVFRNIVPESACQNGYALHLTCDGQDEAVLGTVEGNVFEESHSQGFFANAIYVHQGSARLLDNRFVNLLPDNCAAVYSRYVQSPETLLLRDNEFDSLEYAVNHSTNQEITDARWNWWGDNTGPYNAFSNPEGLGAAVDEGVFFEPWILHEDTTDTNEVRVPNRDILLSPSYSIVAFPNPFNAVSTIRIEVARAGEYSIKIYDVTGRVAGVLFAARIETQALVRVDASELSSGVYFVGLQSGSDNIAVTKVLLLK